MDASTKSDKSVSACDATADQQVTKTADTLQTVFPPRSHVGRALRRANVPLASTSLLASIVGERQTDGRLGGKAGESRFEATSPRSPSSSTLSKFKSRSRLLDDDDDDHDVDQGIGVEEDTPSIALSRGNLPLRVRRYMDEVDALLSEPVVVAAAAAKREMLQTVTSGYAPRNAIAQAQPISSSRSALPLGAEPAAKGRMPSRTELNAMLPEVAATIEAEAVSTMRHLLYPTVFAKCRRRQRERQSVDAIKHAPKVTPANLRALYRGFAQWPEDGLQQLISRMTFAHFDAKDYIVHAGEPPACGMYIIVSGSCAVINPWTGSRRVVSSPFIIGSSNILDSEPYANTHLTMTRVSTWRITEESFLEVFHALPSAVVEETISVAFEAKNRKLETENPMTPDVMRRSAIFAACPLSVLQELVRFAVPYCVPQRHVLCRGGQLATRIVFPIRGRCKAIPAGHDMSEAGRELGGSAVFGDDAVLTSGKHTESLVSLTQTDTYVLDKHLFDSAIRVNVEVPDALHAAFRLQREKRIDASRPAWAEKIATLPLVADLVPREEIEHTLSRLCRPRVFAPVSVLCSAGEYCASVLLILKGKVKIGDGDRGPSMGPGDWAGFTGVVQHRWAAPAVALTLVECVEIPLALLVPWLKDHGTYEEVKARALRLMFPKAFPRHEATAAAALVAHMRAAPLYPVSNARKLTRTHTCFLESCDATPVFEDSASMPSTPPPQSQSSHSKRRGDSPLASRLGTANTPPPRIHHLAPRDSLNTLDIPGRPSASASASVVVPAVSAARERPASKANGDMGEGDASFAHVTFTPHEGSLSAAHGNVTDSGSPWGEQNAAAEPSGNNTGIGSITEAAAFARSDACCEQRRKRIAAAFAVQPPHCREARGKAVCGHDD
jgi:CRP-like cAMP-binding protein